MLVTVTPLGLLNGMHTLSTTLIYVPILVYEVTIASFMILLSFEHV